MASGAETLVKEHRLARPLLKSPEKGAETILYLASSPEVKGVTGQYFVNKKISQSSTQSHDLSLASRLWEVSEKLTNSSSRI